jgi:hypothetical protein
MRKTPRAIAAKRHWLNRGQKSGALFIRTTPLNVRPRCAPMPPNSKPKGTAFWPASFSAVNSVNATPAIPQSSLLMVQMVIQTMAIAKMPALVVGHQSVF